MKTIKTLLFVLAMAIAPMTFIACEEEEEPDPVTTDACLDELVVLANILTEKSNTFSANATVSTCNDVRQAALNLINRAEQCGYGYLYQDQADFWLEYDCTVFQ
jgi:hypothetical protein